MSYVSCWGCKSVSEAIAYREGFGQRETCLIWPNVMEWDTETSKEVEGYSTAYALGLRAQIDATEGWVKTLSNVPINGVLGLAIDVSWSLQDEATDAAVLNREDITTLIMQSGGRFWGNNTCSEDEDFTFESTVRTSQVLADTIAEAHFPYVDKPMRPHMVKTILDNIEAKGRSMVASGDLIGFGAWIDEKINTKQNLKVGKLTIHYNFTDVPPAQDWTFVQVKTDTYFSEFFTSSKLGN
ncbi:Phage tail sheath protein [compost metagenome]